MAIPQRVLDKIAKAKWTNATRLDLSENGLAYLPEAVTRLTGLTSLDLSKNHLIELPEAITRLTRLTSLDLSENGLTNLPETVTRLTGLAELHLYGNGLTKFPEEITQLLSLISLDLGGNGLLELPETVTRLTGLTRLDIGFNSITELSEAVTRLTALTSLNVRRNGLTTLPQTITALTRLQKLDLRNNPLNLPSEIVNDWENAPRIIEYLRKLHRTPAQNRPVNEVKVVLVGEAFVGKTSLSKRLRGLPFDPNEPMTVGIDIHKWNLTGVRCTRDQLTRTVRVNFWDLGGQKIFQATHQFFFSERTIYLLVLSARQTDEQNQLHYWLKTIQALGKDSPVIVVQNQHQSNPELLDQKALKAKYPAIKAFVPTSCPDASLKGIDELWAKIQEQIETMRHVSDLLPPAYFHIKQRLEKITEIVDYLSQDAYDQLCAGEKVDGEKLRADILALLNSLGTVVSFPDNFRLRDTHVLAPEWATDGIYRVLIDADLKAAGDGILRVGSLARIVAKSHKSYPAKTHRYLLDLMCKFELAFERPHYPGEFLVPELMSPAEPADIGDFSDSLRFNIQYEFLPRSILPRFIVRTSHITQTYRWRNGVVLESGGNQAVIRADAEASRVTIHVAGNPPTRRDMLSIIRDHFEHIHKMPNTLTFEEQIPLADYPKAKPVPYQYLRQLEGRRREVFDWPNVPEELPVSGLLGSIERTRRPDERGDAKSHTPPLAPPPTPRGISLDERIKATLLDSVAPDNERYLRELADRAQKGRVVPFIGAGMTIALGMPGWVKALGTMFANGKPNIDIDSALKYGAATATGALEEAAQVLFDVPNLGERWFNDQIKSLFGKHKLPSPITGPLAHLPKIARGPVLTTNFDQALERTYAAAGMAFTTEETVLGPYRADGVIAKWDDGERFLLKLHGDAEETAGRVFTRDQYDHAYAETSKLPELLGTLFGSRRPLLFLGCSLNVDRTLIELKNAGLQQTNAYHFALLESPASDQARQKRQNELVAHYGIQPIWFAPGDFAAIERVLQALADLCAGTV